jgi:uncharacterized pyridoxamine 5'-phosphate oxidase family protein
LFLFLAHNQHIQFLYSHQDKVAFITIEGRIEAVAKLEIARKKILDKTSHMRDMLRNEDEYFDS